MKMHWGPSDVFQAISIIKILLGYLLDPSLDSDISILNSPQILI